MFEGTCEKELRYLDSIIAEAEVAIDVGANEGLFSYKMSKRFSKVYSFEINDSLTKNLAAYNPGNIEIINKGLSSREGSAILYIPRSNGLNLTGWASLTPGNCPDSHEYTEKYVTICPLDSFDIHPVSFIKIDVEGHELEVLKGGFNTLVHNRPIVLIEIKPPNIDEAFSFFAQLQYERKKLQDFVPVIGSEENYIFVPRENADFNYHSCSA
jgi:FkbM family methyltransferase